MDFLNKSFAQLRDLFLSMTPGARITSALLLAVVVISLGYLVTYQIRGPDQYLLGGEAFTPGQMSRMQAAFAKAGLDPPAIDGNRFRVPRGQHTAYMSALADEDALPEDFDRILDEILKSQESLWVGREQRQEMYRANKQKLLSAIVSSMNGIETAWVIYDEETKGGLVKETLKTASVTVTPRGNHELDEATAAAICDTLTAAIAGLKPEQVVVLDAITRRTFRGNSRSLSGGMGNESFALARLRERALEEKIVKALTYVRGVVVTATVKLAEERTYREKETKYEPKPTIVYSDETTSSDSRDDSAPGGRPGFASQQNTGRSLAGAASKGSHQESEVSRRSEQGLPSKTETEKEYDGMRPERATIAVAIPTSYFQQIYRERNPPKEGEDPKTPDPADLDQIRTEEKNKIRSHVASTIAGMDIQGIDDPTQLVTVTEFQDITPPEIPSPGITQKALTWLGQSWTTLGLIGLAGFSLVMLRSMVQAAPGSQAEGSASLKTASETGEEEEVESDGKPVPRKLKRFGSSGASLRDELSELVAEDPETAANILRNWIGSAT